MIMKRVQLVIENKQQQREEEQKPLCPRSIVHICCIGRSGIILDQLPVMLFS